MSPRSKEQNEEIREQSRVKILMAALEIFAEKGYPSASVQQISMKAGMAKGSIYHYFESKEAILEAVIRNGLSEFEHIMAAVHQQQDPAGQLKALIELSFDSIRQRRDFWKLYFSLLTQLSLPGSITEILGPLITEVYGFTEKLLQELGVQQPAIEARVLAAAMDGAFLHYLMLGNDYPLKEIQEVLIKKYTRL